MFAHQAEIFGAYAAYTDHEIGRVIQAVEDLGKLDNTLIIYISGDNGTSAEGTTIGTTFDLAAIQAIDMPVDAQLKFYDVLGSDLTTPHMSVAWTWAFDTPFKWTKQIASFFGGTRQGMAISWPGHIKDVGGIRSQFHHIIDIVPTILEVAGIQAPETVDGIAQKPIEGVSMAYTFDSANANAPSKRDTQYFEMFGNRALYHDGWIAATVPPQPPWLMGTAKMPDIMTGYKWELYNIADDYSENNDLAAKNPDKLKELQALFMDEARKYQVLPLDNSILERALAPRPSATAGRTEFTYSGEVSGLPDGNAPNLARQVLFLSPPRWKFRRRAPRECSTRSEGVSVAMVFTCSRANLSSPTTCSLWNASAGKVRRRSRQVNTPSCLISNTMAPAWPKAARASYSVDGKEVARKTIPHTIPAIMTIDESFDVGVDTRTGVDDNDYQPPFRFTGKLDKLTIKLEEPKRTAAEEDFIRKRTQEVRNAAQ